MRKVACTALVLLLAAAPAAGLEPGELLVGVDASLFVVDPLTGEVGLLSPDPSFGALPSTITGIAATPGADEIFLVLAGFPDADASVWQVDAETGRRTAIARLPPGSRSPGGIAIDAAGDLLVPHRGGVSRIDPRSGAESLLGALQPGTDPTGIAIEANGDLLVSTHQRLGGLSWVLRIEPGVAGFSQVSFLRGGAFTGIALEEDGSILVPVNVGGGTAPPPPFLPAVFRIDPQGGAFELVSTHVAGRPTDLAVESSGEIVVSTGVGSIVRIDPQDGSQTLLVEAPALRRASAIAVAPAPQPVIDVRPAQLTASSRRTLAVVLFGSEHLDVADVEPESLAFGPAAAAPRQRLRVGRRGDAFPDLLLLFRAADAGLQPGDTRACLSGATARFAFEACDEVSVAEPRGRAPR